MASYRYNFFKNILELLRTIKL